MFVENSKSKFLDHRDLSAERIEYEFFESICHHINHNRLSLFCDEFSGRTHVSWDLGEVSNKMYYFKELERFYTINKVHTLHINQKTLNTSKYVRLPLTLKLSKLFFKDCDHDLPSNMINLSFNFKLENLDEGVFQLFACTPGVGSSFSSKKPDFEKIAKYLNACRKFNDHLEDSHQAKGLSIFIDYYIRGDIDFDEIESALIWSNMAMDNGEYLIELGQNWLN